jgi:hypothetical protein
MPTCMVFAARITEGIKSVDDCPGLDPANRVKLNDYMQQFDFDY